MLDKNKMNTADAMNAEGGQELMQVAKELVADSASPSIGPDDAPVALVEFYDYQCIYCHKMFPEISALIKANSDVKFIFKAWPVFGAVSTYAAKVSLLAYKQGKFEAFHNALFTTRLMEGHLTNQAVDDIAKGAAVDLSGGAEQGWMNAEIMNTENLAQQLDFSGTPGFMVLPNNLHPDINKISYFPGSVSESVLTEAIRKAR